MSYSNGPKMITNGLVLYLDAANPRSYVSGSSVWNDLSNNGNNGTLTNGPTYNTGSKGSIVFDGTNDYVRVSSSVIPASTSFTFGIWLNYSIPGSDTFRDIVNNRNYPTNLAGFLFTTDYSTKNGKIRVQLNTSNSTGEYISTGASIATSTPKYANVVVNRESNLLVFYVDGIFDNSFNISGLGSLSSTHSFDIGWDEAYADSKAYFSGTIYNVQVYNRALSASEIKQNYTATKGRFGL